MVKNKIIFSGTLGFGSEKVFEKVLIESTLKINEYGKSHLFIDFEEAFNKENYSISLQKEVARSTFDEWDNTISLLKYCSMFSTNGRVICWMVKEGVILKDEIIRADEYMKI